MKSIKDVFSSIYNMKFYIIIFVAAFLVFFVIYFPQEQVIRMVFNNISAKVGKEIIPSEASVSFFPAIGIDFKSARISGSNNNSDIYLGETSIGIPLTSIITFSPSLDVSSRSFKGEIEAKILGLPIKPGKSPDEIYLDMESKGLLLSEMLKDQVLNIDALVDLAIQGNLNLVNPSYSDVDITSTLSRIQIKEAKIMGFPIPNVSIKKGEIAVAVAKNEIIIAKMNLGTPSDDLNLYVKGKISLKMNNPYDLNIKLKVTGELAQQFASFLAMLPIQAKNAEGFYNIRIKGDKRSPIPQITPIQ